MTAVATSYRFSPSGSELVGARCRVCGVYVCPPRLRHCDQPMDELLLSAAGVVEAWSKVHIAPSEHPTPYRIAYVRLSDGPRVFAKLDSRFPDEIDATGRRVRLSPSFHSMPSQTFLVAIPEEIDP